MEFEFDKEMDALLRQATRSGEITKNTDFDSHLDADEISIFAENELPEKAKARVTKHLADCDRCRIILTNTITLNSEAAEETASSAISASEKEVVSVAAVPWYKRLFATQNLAYSLGALALVFAGMLGFLVVQNTFNSGGSEVALDTASKDSVASNTVDFEREFPEATPESSNSNIASENADLNSTPLEPMAVAKSQGEANLPVPNGPRTADNDGIFPDGKPGYDDRDRNRSDLKDKVAVGKEDDSIRKRGGEPSVEETGDLVVSERKNQKNKLGNRSGDLKRKTKPPPPLLAPKQSRAPRRPAPMRTPRRTPAPSKAADKMVVAGASKVEQEAEKRRENAPGNAESGERNSSAKKVPATKNINGKTFKRRNSVWYDTQYRGQKIRSVRRSSGEYKKLDSGLRTIVSKLGGTVVIVWKSKAYRVR